jgi:hypothetical protein
VAMPDRRKLAAPVLAQAASFVVVLLIGGFTGHPAAPAPHQSPAPQASTRSPRLTVDVPITAADGGVVLHIPVRVLDSRTLSAVASGTLTPNAQHTQLGWSTALPAGTYQVCAQPPTGLRFTEKSTGALPGWVCAVVTVTSAPPRTPAAPATPGTPSTPAASAASATPGTQATVTFHLAQTTPGTQATVTFHLAQTTPGVS